ncbi:FAD dependent oxidoreductase [Microbacterium sp. C448]|uniref:FAD-dependent oxidoreductase n=1 Tax=Microbacterium TaxID=33882 RepID=UPI0003DE2671|nr:MULTISPECIES: FAD-dependent oxidoreductase [Microbacterium]CDK00323.1 FAD dependent oxidoreductase [Microbacterium sp. C448]
MTRRVSHLVIGAGAMGLATTWRLAQRGFAPLALEQFARGHALGASHGATRNFNDAYADPDYLDLLEAARGGWSDLAAHADGPLLVLHGLATHGDDDEVARIHDALTARGGRPEVSTARAAAERWPGMRFDGSVLVSEDAGVVRSQAALAALERAARAAGADIRFGSRVTALVNADDGVRVVVSHGDEREEIVADWVVVTAGAWTSRLIGDAVTLPLLTVTEESPAHFQATLPAEWPSFNHLLAQRAAEYPGNTYGMPTPGEGVKVGFHRVGAVVDPDARTFRPVPALDALLRSYVREWFPGLDAESGVGISCTYTSTDSGDFVLDRRGRIVVGAGFSGHGFKFTPAIGDVLADLATDPTAVAPASFRLPA